MFKVLRGICAISYKTVFSERVSPAYHYMRYMSYRIELSDREKRAFLQAEKEFVTKLQLKMNSDILLLPARALTRLNPTERKNVQQYLEYLWASMFPSQKLGENSHPRCEVRPHIWLAEAENFQREFHKREKFLLKWAKKFGVHKKVVYKLMIPA